jgi:hypothetical protein
MQGRLKIAVMAGLIKGEDVSLCRASKAVVTASFQIDEKIWGILIIVEWTKSRGFVTMAIF